MRSRLVWIAALLSTAAGCGNGSGSPAGGTGGSGGGAGAATLHVVATNPVNGTSIMDFSGAATSEGGPGVWCNMHENGASGAPPFLEITADYQDYDTLQVELFSFDLTAGQSRAESFTAASASATIHVMLNGTTPAFSYNATAGTATGGSCQTTIDSLSTVVSGSFACAPLPQDNYGDSTFDLTMQFTCPLTQTP